MNTVTIGLDSNDQVVENLDRAERIMVCKYDDKDNLVSEEILLPVEQKEG